MAGVKWSDDTAFAEGGECQIGDKIMGLRGGANFKFDFPSDGIQDGNGNYLIKWATTGAAADNFMQFTNGELGTPVKIEALGADANVSMDIVLKGTGVLDVTGLFTINGSVNLNAIINDDTMATAATTNLSTSEAIVNYIASTPGAAGGSDTEIQYNNAGTLDGDSGFTTDGAGSATIVGDLTVDNLNFNGNSIISTDAAGNINLTPDTTGLVNLHSVVVNSSDEISAVTRLDVDNIRIDGNAITSTDTAGNISLTPDTTGDLVLDGLNWPQADGTASQAITTDGLNQLGWSTVSTVTTPTVDQTIARFDGTGGALEDSGVTIDDSDVVSGITQLNVDNLRLDGNTISSMDAAGNIIITPDTTGNLVLDGLNWPQADGTAGSVLTTNGAAQLGFNHFTFENAWTAVPFGSVTAGSPTGSFTGRYDRMGDLVHCTGKLIFTNLGGMDGSFRFDGLPFTIAPIEVNRAVLSIGFRTSFTNMFVIGGIGIENTTTVWLYNMEVDNVTLLVSDMTNTTQIYFEITYRTNDA